MSIERSLVGAITIDFSKTRREVRVKVEMMFPTEHAVLPDVRYIIASARAMFDGARAHWLYSLAQDSKFSDRCRRNILIGWFGMWANGVVAYLNAGDWNFGATINGACALFNAFFLYSYCKWWLEAYGRRRLTRSILDQLAEARAGYDRESADWLANAHDGEPALFHAETDYHTVRPAL